MNVRREEVPLNEVLKGLGETLGEHHVLTAYVAPEPDVEMVWADPSLLRLAMQNIVENARQAMPEGGAIVVTAVQNRVSGVTGVRIEIADSGQGMDQRTLHRAMDPFFSTRPSGTGLGLPITGRILEAHGGRIEVHSRVGEGTRVVLFIPGRRDQRLSEPKVSPFPRA